jgi:hypothetical protein
VWGMDLSSLFAGMVTWCIGIGIGIGIAIGFALVGL